MCGRFVIADDAEIAEIQKILREINAKYDGTELSAKTGDVFPTENAPVLTLENGKPALRLMGWGFPKWDGKGVILNAKSETAQEKRMFSKPLAENRRVVPATGFYEWRHTADGKPTNEKFLFNVSGETMLYMAALYTEFDDNKPLRERFAILTRAASGDMRGIHTRMPVILFKNELINWLKDESFVPFVFGRDDVRLIKQAA